MTMRDRDGHRGVRDEGFRWGIPAAIMAAIIIVGGLFYMNSDITRSTTASSERPAVTQSGPAGSQAPVNTPTTTPAPKQ